MRRAGGAWVIVLLLPWSQGFAADGRAAVEAYVARLAGTVIEDVSITQAFTLYHPDGRQPAVNGTQRLYLKLPRGQRLEQEVDGQREIRLTVGDRVWVRQHDGRTYEAPPADARRDRVQLLTAFQRNAADLLREWRSLGVRDDVSDEVRASGRLVTIVGARAAERDRPAVWIDPEYGVVRFIAREKLPTGTALVDVVFSDHRQLVDRFFFPYRQEVFANEKRVALVTVRSAAVNQRLSNDLFDPEVLKRAPDSARDRGVVPDPEAERAVGGARDPHPGTPGDAERARRGRRLDGQPALREVGPVVGDRDRERRGDVAGPPRQPR